MRIKYDKSCDTFIACTLNGEYRISHLSTGEFILEEIEPPCGDLSYIGTYKTIGNILEELLLDEIDIMNDKGE